MAAFSPKLPYLLPLFGVPPSQPTTKNHPFGGPKNSFVFDLRSFPKNIAISYVCNQKSPLRKNHEIINLYPLVGSPPSSSSFPLKTLLPLFIPLCLHPLSLDPVTLFYPTVKVARRRFSRKNLFFWAVGKKRNGEGKERQKRRRKWKRQCDAKE